VGYSVVNVDELAAEGPGGAVRFVRRRLGVEAFGDQLVRDPAERRGHLHDEAETKQEEVSVVIGGSGVYRVDGDEVPVGPARSCVSTPEPPRVSVAGPDGRTMIAVGAHRGSYEPRGPF
jgi:hypothetical protein